MMEGHPIPQLRNDAPPPLPRRRPLSQSDLIDARPLVLYICRVPGNSDVFLTTSKPVGATVSAFDVLTCLYYVHVDAANTRDSAEIVTIKLLRRTRAHEPYSLIADLAVPGRKETAFAGLEEGASMSVTMLSAVHQDDQSLPHVTGQRFEIIGSTLENDLKTETQFALAEPHGMEEYNMSSSRRATGGIVSTSHAHSSSRDKRRNLLKRLSTRPESRHGFVFTSLQGSKCTMRPNALGGNIKTYENSSSKLGTGIPHLTAELRFNLASDSARLKEPSRSRLRNIATPRFKSSQDDTTPLKVRANGMPLIHSSTGSFDSLGQSPMDPGDISATTQLPRVRVDRPLSLPPVVPTRHPLQARLPQPPTEHNGVSSDSHQSVPRLIGPRENPGLSSSTNSPNTPYMIQRKPALPPRPNQENVRPLSSLPEQSFKITSASHDAGRYENLTVTPPRLPARTSQANNSKEDPMALARQQLGGGNDGEQAKLGKILIYQAGAKMTDALVAANLAVWYKDFLQTSYSTPVS